MENAMNADERNGRYLTFMVMISSLCYVILHSIEVPLEGALWNGLAVLFRLAILGTFLFLLYQGRDWARKTLVVLYVIVPATFTVVFMSSETMGDGYFFTIPKILIFLALFFNIFVLVLSTNLRTFMSMQRKKRAEGG